MGTLRLAAIVLLFVICCTTVSLADPPAGKKWERNLMFTDEFEGEELNEALWYDHNPRWNGHKPGFFSSKNITVSDGKLHLTARAEDLPNLPIGYHTYTTAAVRSKATVLYGYFEMKCKPMRSHISSAFWFSNNENERWTEIDVFEISGIEGKWKNTHNMNVHVWRTPEEKNHWTDPAKWRAPFNFVDDYHVYALEWDKDMLKWYVDGAVVRQRRNTHWHQPLHMNIDSETMPRWFGLPEKDELPSTFSIEYVRSWRSVE